MKKPLKFIYVFIVFAVFLLPDINAQEYMRINLKDGSVIEVKITEIRKLTFENINNITSQNSVIIKQLINLKLYPNPAKDYVFVNYTLVSNGNVTLEIYSMNGILMKSIKRGNQQSGVYDFRLKTTGFSSGMYNCVIRQNRKKISEKLIINN